MCVKFKPNIFPTTLKMNKYKWVYFSKKKNKKKLEFEENIEKNCQQKRPFLMFQIKQKTFEIDQVYFKV